MKLVIFLLGLALAAAHPPVTPKAIMPEPQLDKFNFIDIDLLQLAADSNEGNIVLSPSSVKTMLSMVWEGASGNTANEISQALRLYGSDSEKQSKMHQFQHLVSMPTPGSTLHVASQLFASDRINPNPAYVDILSKYFAGVQKVNMSAPVQAAEIINGWVKNATHGLIPSLVEPESFSESSLMMLTSAIYFRGTWQQSFETERTQPGVCFYSNGDKCGKKVVMMETMGNFRSKLIREVDATLMELPYQGGRYSMLILLPEREDGMPQLVRNLAHGNLLHVLNSDLEESEYIIALPKFSVEYHTDLVPTLNRLKVVDVFTPAANLTHMIKQDPKGPPVKPAVSNVFHKAKVTVDEIGATGAAVTGALVVPLMGGPQPRFVADHPFLFFIRDAHTGSFLFAGRVSDPEAVGAGTDNMVNEATPTPATNITPGPVSDPSHHAVHTSKRSQPAMKEGEIKFPKS